LLNLADGTDKAKNNEQDYSVVDREESLPPLCLPILNESQVIKGSYAKNDRLGID